jgi:hypothetical protein
LGLKLVGALVPGKSGTTGLTKPLTMVDRLSVEGFFEDLLICMIIILDFLFF